MKFLQDKQILKITLLALLIRLLIMPFYFHPDIKTYNFQASFLKLGIWDIYSYLDNHKKDLYLKEEFVYFPLTYFFVGGYQFLASPVLGNNFDSWLGDASQKAPTDERIFRYLFILKFPYLILDFLTAFLLTCFFTEVEKKKKALLFWLFNPLSLILIYVFANVDLLPVFLTILSLWLVLKNQMFLSSLALAIGAGFKAYPLLLLPFLMLYPPKFWQKLGVVVLAGGTFLLILAPFFQSVSFRQATLTSGLTTRLFIPVINLGFNEVLMVPIVLLVILFFININQIAHNLTRLTSLYLAVLLITISTIHFHIQWLLWPLPLAVLLATERKNLIPFFILIFSIAFLIPLLYQDQAMTVGILKVLNPIFDNLPIPFTIVQKFTDPYLIQSVLHSVLVGGSLATVWKIFQKE